MSAQAPPPVKIVESKQTRIGAFTADSGKTAILVCGLGPGSNYAKFELPAGKSRRSLFGRIQPLGNQLYEYKSNDIDSDILLEE